jgi:diadenylate cyclase
MANVRDLLDGIVEGVETVILFSPSQSYYERCLDIEDVSVVVCAAENGIGAERFVPLPLEFTEMMERIRFGVEGATEEQFVAEGDEVVCAMKLFDDAIDSVTRVRVGELTKSGVYDLFTDSRADPEVISAVVDVAVELGQKGQKGKPVGALFVIGDAGNVMNKSRPLSYNPFEKSHVHVGDPIVNVMLKEFSRLDGAFIISDSGKIVSAYRYLEANAEGVDIPKGLGTRHMAAASITRDTNATAVVLSESDRLVRAFKGGELILELDPEEY